MARLGQSAVAVRRATVFVAVYVSYSPCLEREGMVGRRMGVVSSCLDEEKYRSSFAISVPFLQPSRLSSVVVKMVCSKGCFCVCGDIRFVRVRTPGHDHLSVGASQVAESIVRALQRTVSSFCKVIVSVLFSRSSYMSVG